jgi:hypothetical protein
MEENLSPEQIKLKLKNNELITQEKKGKSEVWQKFLEIINIQKQFIGYVLCKNCEQIFTYSQKSGTSHLLRHHCISSVDQLKITSFISKKTIPPIAKELTINKLVNLVCKDLRPFEIIIGDGFREFSQEMINLGTKFGQLQIDELFPHPTTISRNIITEAEKIKLILATKLKNIFQKTGGAFTTDMWTDDYRKLSYISLTVHYIENWELKEQVLAISKFPNISHTAENIKKIIFDILKTYNLIPDRTMKNYCFVTDSGQNFIAAFKNYNHIPCIAHR